MKPRKPTSRESLNRTADKLVAALVAGGMERGEAEGEAARVLGEVVS